MTFVKLNGKYHEFKDSKTARRWVRRQGLSVRDAAKAGNTYDFGNVAKTDPDIPTKAAALPIKKTADASRNLDPLTYARDLTRRILDDYGLNNIRVVASQRKTSCIKFTYNRLSNKFSCYGIYIGTQSIDRAFTNGFIEYKTVRYCWHGIAYDQAGLTAVAALTLHELAHVVHHLVNTTYEQSPHGRGFQDTLLELIQKYQAELHHS